VRIRYAQIHATLACEISTLKQTNSGHESATEAQFERLIARLKATLEAHQEVPADVKLRIIQSLIEKAVISQTGFELHIFAGADQIKAGEASASPTKSWSKKLFSPSSSKNLMAISS
jgi:hypothetical protein